MTLRLPGPWAHHEPDPSPRRVRPDNEIRSGLYGLAKILKDATGGELEPATVPTPAPVLHALGELLHRIAGGEDARHVFGQNAKRGRQSLAIERNTVAALYWLELLKGSAEAAAVKRAATHFPDLKLSAATVRQYAKPHARRWIQFLSRSPDVTRIRTPEEIAATQAKLLARLDKGAKRGRW